MIASLVGRLLVATPLLEDPNFARAVILVCSHHPGGAYGLVLNRPSVEAIARQLPGWSATAAAPPLLFTGGPVQPEIVMALGRRRELIQAEWWSAVTPDIALVDLRHGPGGLDGSVQPLRMFAGYAGWGGGQLEAEIEEHAWFVVDSRADDVFTARPAALWSDVLARQRGRNADLALYANYPANARLN